MLVDDDDVSFVGTSSSSNHVPTDITKAKSVINSVLETCKKEYVTNKLHIPLEAYVTRAAYYTGVNVQILKKQELHNNFDRPISSIPDRIVILQFIKDHLLGASNFTRNQARILHQKIGNKCKDFLHFREELIQMGFEYKSAGKVKVLFMEDPVITFERFHYLKYIKQFRDEGSSIYYIDVRYVENGIKKIPTNSDVSPSESKDYVFLHMVSRKGYECGLFTCLSKLREFHKWLTDIAMPMMNPSSLVVINKNMLTVKMLSNITRYHTHQAMINYLCENNIPCDSKMSKAELFELVDKCSPPDPVYPVQEAFKCHGHKLLLLPMHHEGLSLTELMWTHLKITTIDDKLNFKEIILSKVKELSEEQWHLLDTELIDLEAQLRNVDDVLDSVIDAYNLVDS